jgi:hypothetical protein
LPNQPLRDHEGKILMPTEELENALRSALARAAADIQDAEQERQRLLQRNYRPGRGHRKLAAGITGATAAAAAVLILGLSGVFGSAPAGGTGTIQTTAFTLVKHANGTATLTINMGVVVEPGILQRDLRRDGIPALVTTGSFCSSNSSRGSLGAVLLAGPSRRGQGPKPSRTMVIDPAAMPAGTELSFGSFQLSSARETVIALIVAKSYTCSSAAPATPPTLAQSGQRPGGAQWTRLRPQPRYPHAGGDVMIVHFTG